MGIHEGPRSDLWMTPEWICCELRQQYPNLYDLAANEDNSIARFYCKDFFSADPAKFANSTCWLNPPFSQALAFFGHAAKVAPRLVGIYKANFETEVWQRVLFPRIEWLFCPDKRIAYEAPEGIKASSPQFCSVLFGWGTEPVKGVSGTLLKGKPE